MIKKHHLIRITLACLLAASCSSAALAKQIQLKPGLWQINSQTSLYGQVVPNVNAVLAVGPVALQNHVQNMLRQNRIRIDGNGVATICVTAQQIAENHFANDQGSGCTVGKGRRANNNIHFDISCEAPRGSGQTDVTILSRIQWTASTQLQLTVRGTVQNVGNQSKGTWLGSTCPAGQ
jgi:hypothetical protein